MDETVTALKPETETERRSKPMLPTIAVAGIGLAYSCKQASPRIPFNMRQLYREMLLSSKQTSPVCWG